ncbi:MAG TPA: glycosyltransferase family 4 protein [Actinomycetota bacterium]|nr:glycosyltransferase family 4 protein [Actinomycetota bacterium]
MTFGDADDQALTELVPQGVDVLSGRPLRGRLTRRLPLALQWSWSAELAGRIEQAHGLDPFDLAVISHSYAFHYTEGLGDIPRIVDAQNIESRVYEQFSGLPRADREKLRRLAGRAGIGFVGAGRTAGQIAALEREVWRRASAVACVSAPELDQIAAASPATRTVLAPNSVSHPAAAQGPRRAMTVTFSGSLNYLPNIDAVVQLAEQVAPRLRTAEPDIRLVVAGAEPAPALAAYCADHGIELVANPPVMSEVVAGTVMACPVRLVAGTRLKILDARDLGIPVVTTRLAAEGLDLSGDPGIAVRDDPDGLAGAVLRYLREPEWPPPRRYPAWTETLAPLAGLVRELLG